MKHISILGGGMAGLAVGYYAQKNHFPFTVYEAKGLYGGNCATIRHKGFLFDLGAHRVHDKEEEVTNELQALLGDELQKINVPSVIFREGQLIHFPLSPLDLLKNLGFGICFLAACEVIGSRFGLHTSPETFADYAIRAYGRTVSNAFLLNYTEKLYGRSCSRLSPAVGGQRLQGLNLRTFLSGVILRSGRKADHMEGVFFYPKKGIGVIADALSAYCDGGNLRANAKVTRVFHDHESIKRIEINGKDLLEIEEVVSTLPIDYLMHIMNPVPPKGILTAVDNLKFRSLVLVALFLDKPAITPYATVYFPEKHFPQTRTYEPRNRSLLMAPEGKTSLVSEIPCQRQDNIWNLDDESLIGMIVSSLTQTKWIAESDILDATVVRLDHAYPILELGYEKHVRIIMDYLAGFGNMRLSGRSATFTYSWIHNMLSSGREIVRSYTDASV